VDENRRAHRTAGQVLDAVTGAVLATGEATFMAVPPAEVERLKARYGMRRLPDVLLEDADGDLTDPVDPRSASSADGTRS
jgi:hypothetical protein